MYSLAILAQSAIKTANGPPDLTSVIIAALCSGLLVAVVNQAVTLYRDHLTFRRQKLEELHRAVFGLTFRVETMLQPLAMELQKWKSLREEKQKFGRNVDERLRDCESKVHALSGELRGREQIFDDLEVAIRLISIYFPRLADERPALGHLAQYLMMLVQHPVGTIRFGQDDHPKLAMKLANEASVVGHRVLERIWKLGPLDISGT
jgi:hypothetical protein